jgi:hypothetical protein
MVARSGPPRLRVQSILVPIDAAGVGRRSLPTAAFLANALRARIELVGIETAGPPDGLPAELAKAAAHVSEWTRAAVDRSTATSDQLEERAAREDWLACVAPAGPVLRRVASDLLLRQRRAVLVGPHVVDPPPDAAVIAYLSARDDDRRVLSTADAWARALHRRRVATSVASNGRTRPSEQVPWSNVVRLTGSDSARSLLGYERDNRAALIVAALPLGWYRSHLRRSRIVRQLVNSSPAAVLALASR